MVARPHHAAETVCRLLLHQLPAGSGDGGDGILGCVVRGRAELRQFGAADQEGAGG